MNYLVQLRAKEGYEKVTTKFTYQNFIELLQRNLEGLGLEYKITENNKFVTQSENWKK